MNYPFGRAALAILFLAVSSGLWLLRNPPPAKTTNLTLWTFSKNHALAYQKVLPSFEAANPGVKVDLQLVSGDAVTTRLQAAFWADLDVPDLVEVEISWAGTFFRGPLEHIGFVDLTDRIKAEGLWDRMVQARFAPYTSRGRIFGLPHDVHPVMIAYNREAFEKLNIDVNSIQTWDDFVRVGRQITEPGNRYLIELSDTSPTNLEVCLFQRGGGYFTPEGTCILDNQVAIDTMRWYIPLVAGTKKIGNNIGGGQILTKAVEDGYLLCLIAPDWRTKNFEDILARMSGKMALMPFPAVSSGASRTSTWGGTMLGITKKSKNQEVAWKLARHLYLDKTELGLRFEETNILPALREAWNEPVYQKPRPYWSNQKLGALYAEFAPQIPYQYTSPFIRVAKEKLGEALASCVEYYNVNGEKGFDEYVAQRMKQSADEVRRLMSRNPF